MVSFIQKTFQMLNQQCVLGLGSRSDKNHPLITIVMYQTGPSQGIARSHNVLVRAREDQLTPNEKSLAFLRMLGYTLFCHINVS